VSQAQIGDLHDFYVVVGTAGATLVGLVYVAISINVRIFSRHVDDNDLLFDLVSMTLFSFVALLIIALGFLWGSANYYAVGVALIVAGVFVASPSSAAVKAWDGSTLSTLIQRYVSKTSVRITLAIGWVCSGLGLIFIGVAVTSQENSGFGVLLLYCVPVVLLLLIVFGLGGVWNLLVGLGAVESAEAEKDKDRHQPMFPVRWLKSMKFWGPQSRG